MKKRFIATAIILMFLITGCGTNTKNDLSTLSNINASVSNLFEVDGVGVPTTEGYKKVISSKEANCTQYAYVFARRAFTAGYDVKVMGFTSEDGCHSLVDVKVDDKWYLFDPYNGIYYKSDGYGIIKNPDLVNTMVGTSKNSRKVYTEKKFFQEIVKLEVYPNLNYAEKDLSHEATIIEKSKYYPYPNDVDASINNSTDKDYTAAIENTFPNYFVLKWDEPKEFYRVSIEWLDDVNYASDFEILALVNGKYVAILKEKDYKTDDINYEKLVKKVKTNQIKFIVNNTVGQKRLLLKRFSLYE